MDGAAANDNINVNLLRNSISILETTSDCLSAVPLSTDATQLSKQIWEAAHNEMTSDRVDQSKTSQGALEAMIAMIYSMQGQVNSKMSQQRGELTRLVEDLEKVHATMAMISSSSADEDKGHIICCRSVDASTTTFQFFLCREEYKYDIGKIQQVLKTPMPVLPLGSDNTGITPVPDEIAPSLEQMWKQSNDLFVNNRGLHLSQHANGPSTPVAALELDLPASNTWKLCDLTGQVIRVESQPAARGILADYWKGIWHHDSGTYKVAIKAVRDPHYDTIEESSIIRRAWKRDLHVWRRLHHENILPLLGTIFQLWPQISFVCPWTENGNLNHYLKQNSNLLKVSDRFRMLCNISAGIAYLHSLSIVHGNLCGYRILIDGLGKAYISGFDCSTILTEPGDLEPYSPSDGDSLHMAWAAPELVDFEMDPALTISPQTDIFSFGRVMLQIFSGKIPFSEVGGDPYAFYNIVHGIHPRIPSLPWLTEARRHFMLRCWADHASGDRPNISEVLAFVDAEAKKAQEEERERDNLIDFTGLLQRQSQFPSAGGGFADIWKALWQRDMAACTVAVKVLRHYVDDEEARNKMNRRLRRELTVWQRLDHPNILPLYGVTSDFGFYTSLVCPWLENGNLNNYLEHQGDTLTLHSRLQILSDVAAGLCHLHSFQDPVIHGDLTGSNILIDANENACLCDFGLSTILAEFQGTSYFTSTISGSVRWAAPELYRVGDSISAKGLSTGCDIYSFGSVMLQTLSNQVPYHDLPNLQVLHRLIHGERPERPSIVTMTDEYWSFIEWCWAERGMRPSIYDVCQSVSNFKETCN